MECSGKYYDILTLCVSLRDLYSVFICFRTGICKHSLFLVSTYRDYPVHLFSQFHIAFMCAYVHHHMKILICLFLHCLNSLRAVVSGIEYAYSAYPVEEYISVNIFNHSTIAALYNKRIYASYSVRYRCFSSLYNLTRLRSRQLCCLDLRQCISQFCHNNTSP